ncbi:mismatch-specific thymine-DNA glycosylate [Colletotrichum graminicola]|uniref:Mismatch-specific thymine-DNA glycosylate n=1 Tax=Colletotrichum graminicola (strain M1.001 / M2 / FGSC 10212) TaxID=645133 RepID=E3Q4E2_COLGM|nr:mismatch-specific thymine-DNA glycosylate [Colletotrichum graminicola M1.001]EFQ25454.1 mismatch-specific thymine-DNA glycosylate [Colletotrichum graminicola M1.001]WDK11277.1 mismatch-specific thymine-DNA glycosylate [Colletotrichum graminicola]
MESPFFDREPRPQAASFRGRLQLQDYMFSAATTSAPPGGGAAGTPATAASPGLPSPSPTPLRRSPRKSTALGPVPSPNRVSKHRNASGRNNSNSTAAATAIKSAASTPEPSQKTPPPPASGVLSPKPEPPDSDSIDLALVPANITPPAGNAKPKRRRKAAGYAPPSTYAHLPHLTDILAPGLLILFVGLNPGLRTAALGHAYAHPSNLFWKLLHSSGITPRLCAPTEDRDLPRLYGLGNTNIVARPSRNGAELSKAEMDEGVDVLEDKVRGCRPEVVCIVGKGIWESIWRVRRGRGIRKEEFRYGWQDEREDMGVVVAAKGGDAAADGASPTAWAGARVFVATSTSGLAATLRLAEKERIWRELGEWCERRRAERGAEAS